MREGQPSRTAERVATRRAAHQLLDDPLVFADPFAIRMLEPQVAEKLRADPASFDLSPLDRYLRAFLVVRSRFAEDTLADEVSRGVRQYVLLGAGYDTFGYRNPWPGLRVFEIDHPATQGAKRERLLANGIEPSATVEFAAADLAVTSVREALAATTFAMDRPAVVAWLGVVPYLTRQAIETTLRAIAGFAPGSTLVFDYGIPRSSLGFLGRLALDRMARRVAAAGEPWQSYFTPEEIAAVLRDCGFTSVEDLGAPAMNARYFSNRKDGLRVGEAGHLIRATTFS